MLLVLSIVMMPSFLSELSFDIHILLISRWLNMRSVATLDVAVSNKASRPYWMTLLRFQHGRLYRGLGHDMSSLMWLMRRGIHALRVHRKGDAWRIRGCDLRQIDADDIVHLNLFGCRGPTDQSMMNVANECCKLTSIDLSGCEELTDLSMSALGAGCVQLQSIIFSRCNKVTDAGVAALGAGCGQLQSINLSYCYKVTDAGVAALGAGCGQLQSISLSCCSKVTDTGISALGAGYDQLRSIDLSSFDKIGRAHV